MNGYSPTFSDESACPKCGSKKHESVRFHQSEAAELILHEQRLAQYNENPNAFGFSLFGTPGPPARPIRDPHCGPDEHLHVGCKRCGYVRCEATLDHAAESISWVDEVASAIGDN